MNVGNKVSENDYTNALFLAETMHYNGKDPNREAWWENKRETIINEIISTAAENGVILNRPFDTNETP